MIGRSDDTEDAIASFPPDPFPTFFDLKLQVWPTHFCQGAASYHYPIKQRLLGVSL
ncbi:hypothetical protein ACSYAD_14385 [Acaryochloris marina NIES-2412]|uniref:hypothetical protein n=1 Tax=Acaryochloris marina TaxID=155978 RepID=UPI004057FF1C